MSDQSGGPGWWQASDGKWYPPEARPGPVPPPPPVPQQATLTIPSRERGEWLALGGAVLLILGSFMKWATAGFVSVSGTDGDGWITIIAGGIAAWYCWKQRYLAAGIASAVGLAVVLWKFADLSSLNEEDSFITVSPGAGLYVCAIGAGLCAFCAIWRWALLR
jgi:hypothetical protein